MTIFQVHNDFALLHLTEEFVLKEYLDTICLPQTPYDLGEEFDTRGCFATGNTTFDSIKLNLYPKNLR